MCSLAQILLCKLKLHHQRRLLHCTKKRGEGFSWLKVYGSVFYLPENIFSKFSINCFNFFISLFDPVIRTRTVNKCPPHYNSIEWCDGFSKHVGAIGMCPFIVLWPRLSFRVCFEKKATEVRDQLINLFYFLFPP